MSEYHETTHIMFLPPNTEYVQMLSVLRSQGYIELMTENYYKTTKKAHAYIQRQKILHFKEMDKAIDDFVDNLK